MANLSAIKLPNGTTYNLKDSVSGYTTNTGTITRVKTTAGAHTAIDVTSGAASFNVPTHTSHLTNDSGFLTAHQILYEEKIEWGPTSISKVGSVSPIGMALSSEHSANRLAYINGDALTFEYSSNGGSTYTNYNYAKADKTAFCTTSYGVPIGRISGNYTTSSRTRITLTAQNGTIGYVYTNPRKLLINISSSGGMNVLIEYRTGTNYQNNGSWSTFGTYSLSGWSGWNDIPLILGTLGGGTTQTGNNWQLRLTFIMTSVNSSYPTTAHVNSIRLFGENGWQTTSNLGNTGHLYSYDVNQNAYFPAQITATQFNGNVTGTAGGVAWANVSSKPTATGSSATGITASTTATKTTLGTAFSIPNVTGVGTASTWVFEEISIPNVTSVGSASTWSFTDVTVPIRADSDTTVPTAASSATACDDITAWSAGSGSYTQGSFSGGSGSFSATVTNHVLSFSHTHTAATHGNDSHTHTAPSLSYTARSITGVSGSITVRGVKTGTSSTTTASKASGGNGSAPTLGTAIKVQSKKSGANSTVPTLGTAFSVPNVTGNTSATVSITDPKHTHTIS